LILILKPEMVVAQKQSIDANDKFLKPEVVAAHPL
jgi:hypothetical protein